MSLMDVEGEPDALNPIRTDPQAALFDFVNPVVYVLVDETTRAESATAREVPDDPAPVDCKILNEFVGVVGAVFEATPKQ
jgi:hypothetical protein